MSRWKARVLSVAIVVCLVFLHTTTVLGISPEQDATHKMNVGYGTSGTGIEYAPKPAVAQSEVAVRICESLDELFIELEKDIGGVLGLSGEGPFVLKGNVAGNAEIDVSVPVVVQLPSGGIIVDEWVELNIRGPVTFTGEQGFRLLEYAGIALSDGVAMEMQEGTGGEAPVAITLSEGVRLYADSSVTLHTEGENAITILADDGCVLDLGYAVVSSTGKGATAVSSNGNISMHQAYVQAEGDGAYAIRSAGWMELGQVSAMGMVEGAEIYSAFSSFSQPPQNLTQLFPRSDVLPQRTVVYQNLAYSSKPIEFSRNISIDYWYPSIDPDSSFDSCVQVACIATWDLGGLDYAVPGTFTATATLQPVMPAAGISIPTFTQEITVVPTNRAALCSDWGIGTYASVQCLVPIRNADKILFWVYEEANGWRELTDSGNAVYAEEWRTGLHDSFQYADYPIFYVKDLEVDSYYWVMAEVVGGPMEGFSNLWRLYTGTQNGGDRTGTDRGGVQPATMPTDTENSGSDGDNSGNSDGSGSNVQDTTPDSNNKNNELKDDDIGGNTVPYLPANLYMPDTAIEDAPVDEPARSTTSPQIIQDSDVPQSDMTTGTIKGAENIAPIDDESLPTSETLFDPEQSIPEPSLPVDTATIIFCSVAALGFVLLLVMRLRRWRHGKL